MSAADTQRWIATTSDGREVVIEVYQHAGLPSYGARAACGDWWNGITTHHGPPEAVLRDVVYSLCTWLHVHPVEVRRSTDPSRAQLLAAVATAREALGRILELGCNNGGTLVADEAARLARAARAALPVTT